ncbi:MAG: SUMF1/EgtB/PvdO family nonheme iron enzyme [Planctomycetota bacterium]
MVLIQEGEFVMGFNEGAENQKPEHKVYLKTFYIDVHEITNAEYSLFNPSHQSSLSRAPNMPVTDISYEEAVAYCNWRTMHEPGRFRLPTEAEWEHAARGKENNLYSYGDFYDKKLANTDNTERDASPVEIQKYSPNSYSLYDMTGNVAEWVSDYYDPKYYEECSKKGCVTNPQCPREKRPHKVIRGGSFKSDRDSSQATARRHAPPNSSFEDVGFRCVREP